MNRQHDILCISSIDWDFIWQGHQEIMSRLAAEGHRVLFIENTGVRQVRVSDMGRIRARLKNWKRGTKGFREERPNLFVHSPLVLPLPYSRIAGWINRQVMMRSITRWMRATGFSRPVVWTFLPTPLARDVIARIDPVATVYHCVDEFASSSEDARRIVASEEQLFRDADLVFVTSEKLRERAARFNQRVHLFPSGVSLEAFGSARESGVHVPDDLAKLQRPIAGYVGGIHQWVDQDLLVAAAARLPNTTFALIGPAQVDVSRLQACPNVHLLGQRPHTEVPAYVQGFDVGLVPYRIADYTANVYPAKMNEYLAMGKPVVATDLPEVHRFNREHGDVIAVGKTAPEFAAAIAQGMTDVGPETRERRIAVAEHNGWARRLADMSALIDDAVASRGRDARGWEERLRRLYTTARRRTAEGLIGAVALYLLLFQTPALWWAAAPLQVSAPPQAADAIVVFAGGVGESGKAGGGFQERVAQAVDLYRAGYAPKLIFSSGYVFTLREAEVMKAVAIDNGVPADAILLEEQAANTHQNVTFTKQMLDRHQWRRILLVSSPYHMRRAVWTWHKLAPAIEVTPTPVAESQFYSHTRGASLEQIRGIVHEYAALINYWWKGWI
ncbi:MAG: ElyC/SanA/YdcF family protein [Acidobacteriota bacterium]|nr:ElyC/SanA/YdcF family protein [Acidobacteriota bacterium]